MKKSFGSKKIIFLLPLVIIFISVALIIPYKKALVFQYEDTNHVLAFIPISKETQFKMRYTHSIHRTDVVESYRITRENDLWLYELMYEDFAIGMPSNAEEGEKFLVKDGKYYLKNMKRSFSSIDLRTGKVRANHTVIYRNREYPLSRFIEPGTWVRISVKELNLWRQMEGVNILGD